jgi:hypothetical protein
MSDTGLFFVLDENFNDHAYLVPTIMCKNVLNLSHATSQNMHKYGSNTTCDACNNDPLFCEILDLGCERYGIFSDFCH